MNVQTATRKVIVHRHRFPRVAIGAGLLLAALACRAPSGSATGAVAQASLPREDRLRIVAAMDAHVREHFAHEAGRGGASYDSLVAAFRDAAAGAEDRRAFDLAAQRFAAGLRNGHSSFSDTWLRSTHGQALWFALKREPEGWIVTGSEREGIRRGDIVVAIDGQPIDSVMATWYPVVQESGTRARGWATLGQMAPYLPLRFTVTLASGAVVPVVRGEPAESLIVARRGPQAQTPHRWIVPDSIAYVRIRLFDPRAHEDSALALIRGPYRQAPALIVDVRGNGGGNTPMRLIAELMADSSWRSMPVEASTIRSDRIGESPRRRGAAEGYRGRLIILADHRCGSSCEDFVAPFYENRRATIVGDTTWGSTGQPRFLDLGNGMSFRVSARRYQMYDGSPFEGVGIPPHVVVPLRAAALREGRDEALERAVAILRSR